MNNISDEKLYTLCRTYGQQALQARQKFIGLLPEVYHRRLYEKKGFESIFEFAAKLAGISKEQVKLTLSLEESFEDRPLLKKALIEGEISINKLVRVRTMVTNENEEFWLEQVKVLSQNALETLVRDEKIAQKNNGNTEDNTNGSASLNAFHKPLFDDNLLRAQKVQDLNLDDDIKTELQELQQKGININQLLREFLAKRKEEIEIEKIKLAANSHQTSSRYISVATKNLLKKEHGGKCAIETCQKESQEIHHTDRFSLSHQHNPYFLAPLCKEHHQIAHAVDVKYVEMRQR